MAIFQHFWPSGSLFWLPRPHLCMKLAPREPKDVSHIGWGWGTIRAISSQVSFADNPLLCLTRCFSFFGTEKSTGIFTSTGEFPGIWYQFQRFPVNFPFFGVVPSQARWYPTFFMYPHTLICSLCFLQVLSEKGGSRGCLSFYLWCFSLAAVSCGYSINS